MLKNNMFKRCKRFLAITLTAITGLFLFTADLHACNGKDVILSENLDFEEQNSSGYQLDEEGNLLYDESLINITPEHAREVLKKDNVNH